MKTQTQNEGVMDTTDESIKKIITDTYTTCNGNIVSMTSIDRLDLLFILKGIQETSKSFYKLVREITDIRLMNIHFQKGKLDIKKFTTIYERVFDNNLILFKEFVTDNVRVMNEYNFNLELDTNSISIHTTEQIESVDFDTVHYENGKTESTYELLEREHGIDIENPNYSNLDVRVIDVNSYRNGFQITFIDRKTSEVS